MSAQIRIFLRTDSAMRRELWRTFLSTPTQVCIANAADRSPNRPIDVVVTDHAMDDQSRAALAPINEAGEDAGLGFDGGVISVGLSEHESEHDVTPQDPIVGPASIELPADATARELKLGVLLVNQIVQLQREHGTQNALNSSYQQLAFQDPLTGIANRRAWDHELVKRWDERLAAEGPMCLALIDVDQLKQVNDLLGHAEGDTVLRATATALAASVRDEDFVARLGGDEFGVLLSDIDAAAAHRIVDRIRCSTSRYLATGTTSSDELPVTTSCGYACPQAESSAESLYRRADEALRAAKQAGGNATQGDVADS